MNLFIDLALILALLPPIPAPGFLTLVDWSLTSERGFVREVGKATSDQERVFELDEQQTVQEGADLCRERIKAGKPKNPFCEGLAARMAPQFDFAFTSELPGQVRLKQINIVVTRVDVLRASGFLKDEASYDVLISPHAGQQTYTPDKELTFTGTGTVHLKFWVGFDATHSGSAIEIGSLQFVFVSVADEQTSIVSTGPFVLRL